MTPEGRVKQDIEELLLDYGFIKAGMKGGQWPSPVTGWYYMPVQTGYGVNGLPDFICQWQPIGFFGIETKAPGKLNNLSPNQERRHAEIRAAGATVVVVDSVEMLDQFMWDQLLC